MRETHHLPICVTTFAQVYRESKWLASASIVDPDVYICPYTDCDNPSTQKSMQICNTLHVHKTLSESHWTHQVSLISGNCVYCMAHRLALLYIHTYMYSQWRGKWHCWNNNDPYRTAQCSSIHVFTYANRLTEAYTPYTLYTYKCPARSNRIRCNERVREMCNKRGTTNALTNWLQMHHQLCIYVMWCCVCICVKVRAG